jgi:hypothetical protein
MSTVEQYRTKAIEYSNLLAMPNGPSEVREYQRLERSFTELADNAQWLIDNYGKIAHATPHETAPDASDFAAQDFAAQDSAAQGSATQVGAQQ